MAIKMDGHTITALQLKASDGSEVTKQLTEEGTIPTPTEALSITANGTYDVTDKASAVVNVPAPEINLQTKTATTNGDVVADEGYDGLEKVIVAVSGDVPTLITKSISANGTYNASADDADGYSSVTVNVPAPTPTLQDKTITENGTYSADEGYDGLGEVVVNVSGGGGDVPNVDYYEGTTSNEDSRDFQVDNITQVNYRLILVDFPEVTSEDLGKVCNAYAKGSNGKHPFPVNQTGISSAYYIGGLKSDGGYDYYSSGVSFSFTEGTLKWRSPSTPLFKANTPYRIWIFKEDE